MLPDVAAMRNPSTRQAAIIQFADWFRDLVLWFGGDMKTAARVHYEICVGMERDLAAIDARGKKTTDVP